MFDRRQSFMLTASNDDWLPTALSIVTSTREKVPEVLHVGRGPTQTPLSLSDPLGVAAFATDLPSGLMNGGVQVFGMQALDPTLRLAKPVPTLAIEHVSLEMSNQVAKVYAMDAGKSEGWLEIVNVTEAKARRIRIPLAMPPYISQTIVPSNAMSFSASVHDPPRHIVHLAELPGGNLITVDMSGTARVWQVLHQDLVTEADAWRRLVGSLDEKKLRVIYGDDEEEAAGKREGKGKGKGKGEGSGDGEGDGEGEGEGEGEGNGESSMRGSGGVGFSDDSDLKGRESGTIADGFVLVRLFVVHYMC